MRGSAAGASGGIARHRSIGVGGIPSSSAGRRRCRSRRAVRRATPAAVQRPRAGSGDAQGGAPPPSRRLAPDRDGARAGADAGRRRAAGLSRGCGAALVAPMPCRDQARAPSGVRLPIALLQDAEALERVTARAGRDQGRRWRPLRRDPLGARCSTPRAASPPADVIEAVRARRATPRGRDQHRRPR